MLKLFIKIILLIIIIEGYFRLNAGAHYSWYNWVDQFQDQRSIKAKYFFVGSSRVNASIIPQVFQNSMNIDSTQLQVLNMGMGNATLAAHYFGLKKIIDAMPNELNDVVIFLEAYEDFPELSTWDGDWVENNRADLLARVLDYDDLAKFFIEAHDDIELKLAVCFEKISYLYRAKGTGISLLAKYENMLRDDGILPKENSGDLLQGGGIKIRSEDIQRARNLAISAANSAIGTHKLAKSYDKEKYVLYSLNKLIQDNRGKLILFDIPLSDVQKNLYANATTARNKAYIYSCLKLWGIPLIEPGIKTTNDDFPDLWHLSGNRAAEFTTSVADTYKNFLAIEKK